MRYLHACGKPESKDEPCCLLCAKCWTCGLPENRSLCVGGPCRLYVEDQLLAAARRAIEEVGA